MYLHRGNSLSFQSFVIISWPAPSLPPLWPTEAPSTALFANHSAIGLIFRRSLRAFFGAFFLPKTCFGTRTGLIRFGCQCRLLFSEPADAFAVMPATRHRYRSAGRWATLRHSPNRITHRGSGGHHGEGSDAQQQRKEEAEAGQEQEERRRSALTVRRHAQSGQTRHLVHEPIRQEALAGDHRARPELAPYHFGDDRANMRCPTSGSGQKTGAR